MTEQKLTSLCLHCKKRVDYGRLPKYPDDHPKANSRNNRGFAWHHYRRPAGEELLCDPTGANAELFQKRATPKSFCAQRVNEGSAYDAPTMCNRRMKELVDGVPMCGIHATRIKSQRAKDAAHRQKSEISNYIMTETMALAAELDSKYGISGRVHYDQNTHEYTGLLMINPRHLMDFLEEIFG